MAMANKTRSVRIFHDAIHGSMQFSPICVDIINTVQFQRLRNIKQLGLCYYVYPSASHNRFEHCLGTCHLAGKMIRHLKQQDSDLKISDEDTRCVEIAGLCHDLGHAPFSHVFQEIINEYRKEKNLKKWEHEEASCKMLQQIIDKNSCIKDKLGDKSDENICFIKSLITGKPGDLKKPNFFYQIVNNADYNIDVDKWDYLARDSHLLGIGTSFDHERMLKMSKVIDGKICYRDKTLKNFYDMFYSRYRLHNTVYQHKTVLLLNKLLGKALKSADEHLKIFKRVENMEEFTYFTDSILEEMLKKGNEPLEHLETIINRSFHYKGTVTDIIKGTFTSPVTDIFELGDTEGKILDPIEGTREDDAVQEKINIYGESLDTPESDMQDNIQRRISGTITKKSEKKKIEGTIDVKKFDQGDGKMRWDIDGTINGKILGTSESKRQRNIDGKINGTIETIINSRDEESEPVIANKTDEICIARFDYGAKEKNPLLNIPFYRIMGNKPMYFKQEELEDMLFLPKKFKMETGHCFELKKKKQ
ncbi:Hypothetical predicted protein [Octopus vulgaris]|uniref:HD domain-containing protein n=1 Tax=Octopus vulgaris TaxID=6645 RepID=A0AA36FE84_OCTVU|nr:Hypothetical predicted protein [Octopus vulgaris]